MNSLSRILALAVIAGLFTIPVPASTKPPAPPVEEPPHMQQALEALRQARHHLEAALPDKGGHRTAAIKACDQAIRQAELGMKDGDHHDHEHDQK